MITVNAVSYALSWFLAENCSLGPSPTTGEISLPSMSTLGLSPEECFSKPGFRDPYGHSLRGSTMKVYTQDHPDEYLLMKCCVQFQRPHLPHLRSGPD